MQQLSLVIKRLLRSMYRKTLIALAIWMCIVWQGSMQSTTSATDAEQALTTPPLDDVFVNNPQWADAVDIGKVTKTVAIDPNQGAVQRIIDVFFDNDLNTPQQKATYYIKGVLNLFLSIIGFVALVYLIYGFYKMFTASGDDWRKEAQKIVVWSLIALAIMGVARFIVSWFFAIYEKAITPVALSEPSYDIQHVVPVSVSEIFIS